MSLSHRQPLVREDAVDAVSAALGGQSGWLVAKTHVNRERQAIANLVRQGFEVYCPLFRRRVRHARRVTEVLRPFFPGYVFVRFERHLTHWRPILSTVGVHSVVRAGDEPGIVSDALIERLRAREVDGVVSRPAVPYEVGQQVRLANGALDGLIATIIGLDEKERVVLLLDILSRPVKVRVDALSISPVR